MNRLEYFDGKKWTLVGTWENPHLAWISLGGDNYNYRVVAEDGTVLFSNKPK
jgi:hypothetical protein